MARFARVVILDVPHQVTQRGNRRLPVFFSDEDRVEYLQLLADAAPGLADKMPRLVSDGQSRAPDPDAEFSGGSARDARQGTPPLYSDDQFPRRLARASVPRSVRQLPDGRGAFDGSGALCRAQCSPEPVEGPVTANLVERAADYRWSSARSHIAGERTEDDPLTDLLAFTDIAPNWSAMLRHSLEAGAATMEGEAIAQTIETRLHTGRPLAAEDWIARQEERLGRRLRPRKRGPKPKAA